MKKKRTFLNICAPTSTSRRKAAHLILSILIHMWALKWWSGYWITSVAVILLPDRSCGCCHLWAVVESVSVPLGRTYGNSPAFTPVHSSSWISLWAFTQHHVHPIWRPRQSTQHMMGCERFRGTGLEVWRNNKNVHFLMAECRYQQIWITVTVIHGFGTPVLLAV